MTPPPAGLAWRNHFRRSLIEELPAHPRDAWHPSERQLLGPSLAEFQLGESSGGNHLLRFAREFGETAGDAWLAEAMALFIQEENRHSHWLGEFLKAQNFPLLRSTPIDSIFRQLRRPLGFGLMAGVLVSAEIVAVPYYAAVGQITGSVWLRTICQRILRDEAIHLRFQAENLGAVWRTRTLTPPIQAAHRAFMTLVCLAVWPKHGAVLRRGGFPFPAFHARCRQLLAEVHANALAARPSVWPARLPAPVR